MPIYLFNLVAGLREKNAKGYPVKKVSSVELAEERKLTYGRSCCSSSGRASFRASAG